MKKHNYFFEAYNTKTNDILTMISIRLYDEKMFPFKECIDDLGHLYFDYIGTNVKNKIQKFCPEVIDKFNEKLDDNILTMDNVEINIIDSYIYRQYNKNYDNECKFVEYINSEKAKEDKETVITEEILKEAGFENTTKDYELEYYKKEFCIDDYSSWHYSTDKEDAYNYIIIDFQKGITNSFATWNIHLDNNTCCSIGSVEISTIWQFNTLMEIYGSNFRL